MRFFLVEEASTASPPPPPPPPPPTGRPPAMTGAPVGTYGPTSTGTVATPPGGGTGKAQPQGCGESGGTTMIIMMVVMFGIFYFLLIRPQKKRDSDQKNMLDSVKKNDKIVTIGGIHGVVDKVKKDEGTIVIKIDDSTKMTFGLRSIQSIVPKKSEEEAK